jgi:hypothetical protein
MRGGFAVAPRCGIALNKQRHPPFLFTPASAGFLFLPENYVKIAKRLPFTVDL